MKRSCLIVAFCAGVLAPSTSAFAKPSPADALLKQAEREFESLDHEMALETLGQLQRTQGLSEMQRARSLLYSAVCQVALGRTDEARLSFTQLLRGRPRFRMPAGVSPAIRGVFAQALEQSKLPPEGNRHERGRHGKKRELSIVKIKGSRPRLAVDVRPGWGEVWVDGTLVGFTPYNRHIRAGPRKIRIRGPHLERDRLYQLRVEPGTLTKIRLKGKKQKGKKQKGKRQKGAKAAEKQRFPN